MSSPLLQWSKKWGNKIIYCSELNCSKNMDPTIQVAVMAHHTPIFWSWLGYIQSLTWINTAPIIIVLQLISTQRELRFISWKKKNYISTQEQSCTVQKQLKNVSSCSCLLQMLEHLILCDSRHKFLVVLQTTVIKACACKARSCDGFPRQVLSRAGQHGSGSWCHGLGPSLNPTLFLFLPSPSP
jgi:hypothetical protein